MKLWVYWVEMILEFDTWWYGFLMEYVIYVRSGYGVQVWRCVWGLGFRCVIGGGFFWSGVDGSVSFSLSISSSTAR